MKEIFIILNAQVICAKQAPVMQTKLTSLREQILNVIQSAESPINVKRIAHDIPSQPNMTSVYRALAFLEAQSLVQSVSFDRTKFYYTSKSSGCGHFIFCKECHEMKSLPECMLNHSKLQDTETGYQITGHLLFVEGFCPECSAYLNKKEKVVSSKALQGSL